ncbi:XRE family transcriptional regulator [Pseudonocardiaceae bacterium YIM PH 21723]|nr:XRE family transcriptional regulator [Pseudonocardiaceae bacterium YIM PH 21723]
MTGVSAKQITLALDLRAARLAAGFRTYKEAAAAAHLTTSALWFIETVKNRAKPTTVLALTAVYGCEPEPARRLVALAEEISKEKRDAGYIAAAPKEFADYLRLESESSEISSYEAEVIPGLLQTREYQRALLAAGLEPPVAGVVERLVELRAERQRAMLESGRRITFVINEAALHRMVGGREVLLAQLCRLLELWEHPALEIRVLPFGIGAHPGLGVYCTLLQFDQHLGAEGEPYKVAFLEMNRANDLVTDPDLTLKYQRTFERVADLSSNAEESRRLIATVKERLAS